MAAISGLTHLPIAQFERGRVQESFPKIIPFPENSLRPFRRDTKKFRINGSRNARSFIIYRRELQLKYITTDEYEEVNI